MSENNKREKQHTPEFEACIQDVMRQGHAKGSAFAICTATFGRAKKPLYVGEFESQKLHLFSESIKISKGNMVSGVCIHPKRIFHPEEGVEHVYLREELEKAAPTLIGKPFGVDHVYPLPPPNVITNSWYDPAENGVAFEGVVDETIAEQIRNEAFKGVSVELDWLRPGGKVEYMNGVAPRNFELSSVHLLRNFPPGDKEAFIKLWNGVMEQLVLGPPRTIDDRVDALESSFKEMRTMLEVVSGKIDVLSRSPPSSLAATSSSMPGVPKLQVVIPIGEKAHGHSLPQLGKVQEAQWTTEYVNDLADSAFAAVEPSGREDEQGKTTPRSLRHLEHHDDQGNVDQPHVANALQRLDQTKISDELKEHAKRHLCNHAKELGMASEVCGLAPKQSESEAMVTLRRQLAETEAKLVEVQKASIEKEVAWAEKLAGAEKGRLEPQDVVALRKQVVDAEAKFAESEKQTKAIQDKYRRFREAIKGTHPVLGVQRSWSMGPQKMIAEQLRVLREFQE